VGGARGAPHRIGPAGKEVDRLASQDMTWWQPLWRRLAVTGFLVLWFAFELLWTRDRIWGVVVGALLLYALYRFFYAFRAGGSAAGHDR
jgi:hypothetical protein